MTQAELSARLSYPAPAHLPGNLSDFYWQSLMRIKTIGLALLGFLSVSLVSYAANIDVTPGTGKTVATTTDGGREFQNVVVSTLQVRNDVGVTTPVGFDQAKSSYMPTAVMNQPTIANTSFTSNQGTAGTVDWPVRLTSTTILGTVTVDGSGVTQPVSGTFWQATQPISGTVTDNQGTPSTLDWPVRVSSTNVSQSTVTIITPNNNTTAIPITGSISNTGFNVTNSPNVILQQSNVLGATVTYNGTQNVTVGTLYQPSVIGATVTFNGAQSVIPMEPNVWGTTTTLQASNNAIGSVWSTSTYVINPTTSSIYITNNAGTGLTGVGYQSNAGSVPVNIVNTVTVGQHNVIVMEPNVLGATVTFNGAQLIIPVQPGSEVLATTTTLQTSQNMIGQTSLGILNVTGSTLTVGYQNGQSSAPVSVMGFGKSGTDVTDSANTALRVNVVAGGGAGGGTSSSFGSAFPAAGTSLGLMNSGGNTGTGRMDTSSNTYTVPQVAISSSTSFPIALPNNSSGTLMGDPYGRLVTMAGVPTALQLSTTTDAIANTSYVVLVASPATTLFTHMCGCIITNTAATAASVDIIATGNKANGTGRDYRKVFVPATDSRGIWPGCDSPFINSNAGGVQISALSSTASASLTFSCQYFQNAIP